MVRTSGFKNMTAKKRGELRKRRRHRAERREATLPIQQAYNDMMREQGHPGWTGYDHGGGSAGAPESAWWD